MKKVFWHNALWRQQRRSTADSAGLTCGIRTPPVVGAVPGRRRQIAACRLVAGQTGAPTAPQSDPNLQPTDRVDTAFSNHDVAGVPLLVATPPNARTPLPAVLWFHGLGVDKETHRKELAQLAGVGFAAVGVDAPGHGARRTAAMDVLIAGTQAEAEQAVIDVAIQSAGELGAIIGYLEEQGIAEPGRSALAGVSMGAYIVYQAVAVNTGFAAAVAILGSPHWPSRASSPAAQPDAFCRTPTLSIVAERDANVPPAAARDLHRRLERCCGSVSRLVVLPGAEHLMAEEHWNTTMRETLHWLSLHLLHDREARP